MEKKKSVVIQAKFIESFEYNGKTYYSHGVAFKNKDVGIYNCLKEEQEDFMEGIEAEYTIAKNEKEPKKSKIRPIKEQDDKTTDHVKGIADKIKNEAKLDDIDKYIKLKKIDMIAFTARYVSDMIVSKSISPEDFVAQASIVMSWQIEQFDKIK